MTPAEIREQRLAELHTKLTDVMLSRLANPDELTAQDLNAIRQFLKDNDINAVLNKYTGTPEDAPIMKIAQTYYDEFNESATG